MFCVLFFHSKCFLRKTYQLTSFFWISSSSAAWGHIVIWNSRALRYHFTSTNMAIKKDKLENTCITLAKKHDVLLNWDWLWPKYPSLYACVRFATIFLKCIDDFVFGTRKWIQNVDISLTTRCAGRFFHLNLILNEIQVN